LVNLPNRRHLVLVNQHLVPIRAASVHLVSNRSLLSNSQIPLVTLAAANNQALETNNSRLVASEVVSNSSNNNNNHLLEVVTIIAAVAFHLAVPPAATAVVSRLEVRSILSIPALAFFFVLISSFFPFSASAPSKNKSGRQILRVARRR
jgi:hypothetical protein